MLGVRLPFRFGQRVNHKDWPTLEFIVLSQEIGNDYSWTIAVTDQKGGGWWKFPASELTTEHWEDQLNLARWMGYGDNTWQMNQDHDKLHEELAEKFGYESLSMRVARGEHLSHEDYCLSNFEEEAVINLQRFLTCQKKRENE